MKRKTANIRTWILCGALSAMLPAISLGQTVNSGETKTINDVGTGAITVLDGGTLQLPGGTWTAEDYPSLTIAGTGNGGLGAINSITGTNKTFGAITLTGDATIQSAKRYEINGSVSGAYTLTKKGGDQLLLMCDSQNLQKIVSAEGQLVAQVNANGVNAIDGLEVTGGNFQIWGLQNVNGNINFNGGYFNVDGGAGGSTTGTITLSKDTEFRLAKNYTNHGPVTGGMAVTKSGAGTWSTAGDVNIGDLHLYVGAVTVNGNFTAGRLRATDYSTDQTTDSVLNIGTGAVAVLTAGSDQDHRLGHWKSNKITVNISDGSLQMVGITNCGWDGTGIINQTGGSAQFDSLNLSNAGSQINLSGGTTTIETLKLGRREGTVNSAYLNSGTVTLSGTADVTIGSVNTYHNSTINIQDSAALKVTGNMILGQTDSETGFTSTVNQSGGTVTIEGSLGLGHWPNSSAFYTLSNGTLNVLNFNAANYGQTGIWLGLHSPGTLNQTGGTINAGRIDLNGRNDSKAKGTYTMTGGTLNLGSGGIMHTKTDGSYLIELGGGTLSGLNGADWSTGLNATLTGTNGKTTFNCTGGTDITWSGALSGAGGIVKTGESSLNLDGNNTFTGGLDVNLGTVNINGDSSGATGGLTMSAGTTTSDSNVATVTVNVNSGAKFATAAGKSISMATTKYDKMVLNVAGTLDNDGALALGRNARAYVKNGGVWNQSGTMSVTANGGYPTELKVETGGTFVYDGAEPVYVNPAAGNIGNATLTINGTFVTGKGFACSTKPTTGQGKINLDNGTLRITDTIPELCIAGTDTATPTFSITGTSTIDTNGFDLTITPAIGGTGTLNKTGSGTLNLGAKTGTTITGINLQQGKLVIADQSLVESASITTSPNTILDLGALDETLDSYSLAGSQEVAVLVKDGAALANVINVTDTATVSDTARFLLDSNGVELDWLAFNNQPFTLISSPNEITLGDGASLDAGSLLFPEGSERLYFSLSTIGNATDGYQLQATGTVPEPASWLLLILGAAGLTRLRRIVRYSKRQ